MKIDENFIEYDCWCPNPECLKIIQDVTPEACKPFFHRIMEELYFNLNWEILNIKDMSEDEYNLTLHFTCKDVFDAMFEIMEFLKEEKKC